LDAFPATQPWYCGLERNILHFNQVQGVSSVSFAGSATPVQRASISMADWPRFAVYNFYNGGSYPASAGQQIRSVESVRHFRTWIAARQQARPADQVSNYIFLSMIDFAIKTTITLDASGSNPLFANEYRAAHLGTGRPLPGFGILDVAVDYGVLTRRRGFQRGQIRWDPYSSRNQPVLAPPLANDDYPAQLNAQNGSVGPSSLSLSTRTRCLQRGP
jgi:hypothetical protein